MINILLYDFGRVFILSHFVSCQEFDFASPLRSKMSYLNLTLSASLFPDNPQPNSLEIWRKLRLQQVKHIWGIDSMLQCFKWNLIINMDIRQGYTIALLCISIKYGSSNFLWEENFSKCCFYNVSIFFKNVKRVDF